MKRSIPLEILEILQPITDKNKDLIFPVKNSEVLWHVVDRNEDSNFFFKVIRQEQSNTRPGYVIEYSPKNKQETSMHKVWVQLAQIGPNFDNWLKYLQTYNEIKTVYDDPILLGNQQRFEKQFEILEDDADTTSFDLNQQIYLNEYIETAKKKIATLKNSSEDNSIEDLADIERDALKIQENLTKETKRQIVKRLARFWAKAQRIGLNVIKEIFVDVASDLTKRLLSGS